MSPLADAMRRIVDALMGRPQRPRVIDDAIEQDGRTPEELDEYYRNGGGIAPSDAPTIDEGGI